MSADEVPSEREDWNVRDVRAVLCRVDAVRARWVVRVWLVSDEQPAVFRSRDEDEALTYARDLEEQLGLLSSLPSVPEER
ncbi:MAG: hypothetical protein AAGH15_24965 [Myxococcota bacterium]